MPLPPIDVVQRQLATERTSETASFSLAKDLELLSTNSWFQDLQQRPCIPHLGDDSRIPQLSKGLRDGVRTTLEHLLPSTPDVLHSVYTVRPGVGEQASGHPIDQAAVEP